MTTKEYRSFNFIVEFFKKIKDGIINYFKNFKVPWVKIFIVILIGILGLSLYLVVSLTKVRVPIREPYDKTGFVLAKEYRDNYGDVTIIENDQFAFTFDNKKTLFTLTDKETGEDWTSNPIGAAARFQDPFIVYFAGPLGAVSKMGVIDKAVNYDDFLLRLDDDSLEVLYLVGGKKEIDQSDFPKIISDERMQEMILSKLDPDSITYRRVTEQYYDQLQNEEGVWRLRDSLQPARLVLLYEIFYDICGYTEEDLKYDLELYDIKYEDKYPYIEISIRYTLTDEGLEVVIINDSIVEKANYPLVYIDVLPYYGCAGTEDSGYTLVPDGSGALIEHNNLRSYAMPYNQRLYGKDIVAKKDILLPHSEKAGLPIFGIKRNNQAFIAICEEGAEQATLIARASSVDNPYNQAYYRYLIREYESFDFRSKVIVNEWTPWYNTADFTLKYCTVREDEGSYVAMAKVFQNYLLSEGLLQDSHNRQLGFNLTVLGGYIALDNFLGIPYQPVRSLTNTKETLLIAEALHDAGIRNLNIIYSGWANDGIKPTYAGKVYYNRAVGTQNDFKVLQEQLSQLNIGFYPEVYLQTAYTNKDIKESRDVVRNVLGRVVKHYGYSEASLYANPSSTPYFTLKPTIYQKAYNTLVKNLSKININSIAFRDFGGELSGSYYKKETYFRTDTKEYFDKTLTIDSHIENIAFHNPNLYALPYSSLILDLPVTTTPYQIINVAVPFYQLTLNGYIDYSGRSFNIDDKYSYNWHKMKAIETLSSPSFTWSYKSTVELADTEYSYYYSTDYLSWYEKAIETYQELDGLGVFNQTLINHKILIDDGSVVKSVYSNGKEIVFNYGISPYIYNGITIYANSYQVVKGAE